jgi:hypothetical protein
MAQYLLKLGTYTGDGTDSRNITGVGFQPDLVMIFPDDGTAKNPVYYQASMPADTSSRFTSATLVSNWIQSLLSDGFQIGSEIQVNANGSTFRYVAFKKLDGEVYTESSYTGDGTDNRNISVGFQTTMAQVKINSGARVPCWKIAENDGEDTMKFESADVATDAIQSMVANGFQVGTTSWVNSNGVNYYYFGFKATTGYIVTGTYNGNGTSQSINTGFSPALVFVKRDSAMNAIVRGSNFSACLDFAGGDIANAISITSTGFDVGSAAAANYNGAVFRYFAILGLVTNSATIASDAVIKSAVSGQISSNAFIKKSPTAVINSDAYLRKETTSALNSDYFIKGTLYSIAQTLGYIKKLDNEVTINGSAHLQIIVSGTIASDYFILKPGYEGTLTQRAHIKATYAPYLYQTLTYIKKPGLVNSINSDYYLKTAYAASINSDSHINKITDQALSSDYFIKHLAYSQSKNQEAYIQKTDNSDTIASDAFIRQSYSSDLLSDFYIFQIHQPFLLSNYEIKVLGTTATINSDSYIIKEAITTIQSDAFILKSSAGIITSDASLTATYPAAIDCSAYIKKLDNAFTITQDAHISLETEQTIISDSFIKQSSSGTISSDAEIKKLGYLASISQDANIKVLANSATVTSDAWIRRIEAATLDSDYRILESSIGSISQRAYVKATSAPYLYLLLTYIKKASSFQLNSNSMVEASYSSAITSDSFIGKSTSQTITADYNLKQTYSPNIDSDASIKKLGSASLISTSYVVKKTYDGSLIEDAYIEQIGTSTIDSNAEIKAAGQGSIISDAEIKFLGYTATISSDSYLKVLDNSTTISGDAYIVKPTGAVLISDYMILGTNYAIIDQDMWIFKPGVGVLICRYYIKKLDTTQSINSDYFVNASETETLVSDAWIRIEVSQTLVSDYIIKREAYDNSITTDYSIKAFDTEVTITQNAYLGISGAWSDWCEFEMRVPISVVLTSDYYVMLPVYVSLPADYFILTTTEESLISNYYIRQTYEKYLSSDYSVRGGTKPDPYLAETINPVICSAENIEPDVCEVVYLNKPVIVSANTLSYRDRKSN